ncbi:MAG: proton-conducting transporter membrane subunit, partial [Myxococcota bacterium]
MIPAPEINISVLAPIAFVGIGAMFVLLCEVFLSRKQTVMGREVTESFIGTVLAIMSMFFLMLTTWAAAIAFDTGGTEAFNSSHAMYQLDVFSSLVTAVVAFSALLSCALSIAYLAELRINHGEYYALLLLSTSGMMLMVAAIDMLAVFLGLELMSIPLYVLAGFDRRKLRSNESALKYFLIGSFASAIMLYGMALLYGATGSTSFAGIGAGFEQAGSMGLIGLGMVIVGFAFKISTVPFHQWTPDVY